MLKGLKKTPILPKSKKMRGGESTLIHVLYVLGKKDQPDQLQVVAMSKSIKNLHMFAKDLPDNLTYPESRSGGIFNEFQKALESGMAIDTIELDNPNTSHNWRNVSLPDIDRQIENGVYDGSIEEIAEVLLYYTFDRSSPITGVVGAVYSNDVPGSDGQMMTEFGNFNNALTLLDNYEPMELKVDVLDHNLSVNSLSRDEQAPMDTKPNLSSEVPRSSGKPTKLYLLYALSQKSNPNPVQLVAISQSLKNIHMIASDLPENLIYPESRTGGIFNEFKQALENNMVIDTIDYTNRNDSHNWQKVNLGDIDRMKESGEYDGNIDQIDEITLYYTLDNSSPIPGVVDSININLFRDSSNEIEIKTEFGNFDNALQLLNNYDPMDLKIDVADNLIVFFSPEEISKINKTNITTINKVNTPNIPSVTNIDSNQKIDNANSVSQLTNKLPLDKNTINLIIQGKMPNVTLKELILQYRDRIPELLKEFTPEYLFETGLFSYGDLKPHIKGNYSKKYLEVTKDCKKNWRRQTNLDCKFIPDTFPKPNNLYRSVGRVVNETERYPQKE